MARAQPIVSVQAMTATMSSNAIEVESTISIQFRLDGGAVGTMHFAYALPRSGGAGYMALRGTTASVTIDAAGATEWIGPGNVADPLRVEAISSDIARLPGYGPAGAQIVSDMLEAIANNRDPLGDGRERPGRAWRGGRGVCQRFDRPRCLDRRRRSFRWSVTMRETLRGVWVAMPTPWQADGAVDAAIVRELVGRYAAAGLHGAYTTGTDGEVHVMEVDELRQLVAPFARIRRRRRFAGSGWLRLVTHEWRHRARPRRRGSRRWHHPGHVAVLDTAE